MSHEAAPDSSQAVADLLAMKVSAILEAHPAALEVLVEHGFAPLRQPHLRAALANTVTLAQALRIRSLTTAKERVLLDELALLFDPGALPSTGTAEPASAAAAAGGRDA